VVVDVIRAPAGQRRRAKPRRLTRRTAGSDRNPLDRGYRAAWTATLGPNVVGKAAGMYQSAVAMNSLIQRFLSVLTSLAVFAFVVAPHAATPRSHRRLNWN
jgi:hypothetical protein